MKANLLFSAALVMVTMTTYIQAQSWNQKGTDMDGEVADDRSGWSISMPDKNTIAIGADWNDGNGSFSGHVRIYSWNPASGGWVQKGMDINGEASGNSSGWSVSMPDNNTVAIGAPYNNGNQGAGHVRIYAWRGNAWIQKGSDIDGDTTSDQSGHSVCMPDSNTVAIGAPNNDGNGNNSGHVRIYRWNPATSGWVQKGADLDGEAADDESGFSVSMPDSNTIAIGAYRNDDGGTNAGQVRIYTWDPTSGSWVQKGADLDGEAANDHSGYSVSMPDSNVVAIGAYQNDGSGTNSGQVRVYRWNGNGWVQKGADLDGEGSGDGSGWWVSMPDINTVAIGAQTNYGSNGQCGHARIFSWNPAAGAWVQKGLDIDGEAANDRSGSVSMPDSNTVAIGAYMNDGNGTNAGHVRVFTMCTSTTSSISQTACDQYVSPSGNHVWTASGTYADTISNQGGCDSVITVNLTIDTVNTSVANTSPVLTAIATGATYQWLDCNNAMAVIPGATGQSFTATVMGSYAVRITQNSCTDTSTCEAVFNVSVLETSFENKLIFFPNPSQGQVEIELGKAYNNVVAVVRNEAGQVVSKEIFAKATSMLRLNLPAETGFYLVEITAGDRSAVLKVIKK